MLGRLGLGEEDLPELCARSPRMQKLLRNGKYILNL